MSLSFPICQLEHRISALAAWGNCGVRVGGNWFYKLHMLSEEAERGPRALPSFLLLLFLLPHHPALPPPPHPAAPSREHHSRLGCCRKAFTRYTG